MKEREGRRAHDGLGNEILDGLTNDGKVGRDQRANQARFHLLPLRQSVPLLAVLWRLSIPNQPRSGRGRGTYRLEMLVETLHIKRRCVALKSPSTTEGVVALVSDFRQSAPRPHRRPRRAHLALAEKVVQEGFLCRGGRGGGTVGGRKGRDTPDSKMVRGGMTVARVARKRVRRSRTMMEGSVVCGGGRSRVGSGGKVDRGKVAIVDRGRSGTMFKVRLGGRASVGHDETHVLVVLGSRRAVVIRSRLGGRVSEYSIKKRHEPFWVPRARLVASPGPRAPRPALPRLIPKRTQDGSC